MLTRHACTAAELSCIIGNVFAELSPPCDACGCTSLVIHGKTITGHMATLTVTEAGFDLEAHKVDTELVQRLKKGRCIHCSADKKKTGSSQQNLTLL